MSKKIRYRSPLEPSPEAGTAIDGSIVTFTLPRGTIEVNHMGTYLDIRHTGFASTRFLLEPQAGNVVRVTLES